MSERNKHLLPGLILTTLGFSAAIAIFRLRYRRKSILQSQKWKNCIAVIDTVEKCAPAVKTLREKCKIYKVLGFDCEWVTTANKSQPVALLQLASSDGYCVLIRLCMLKCVPSDIKDLLEDIHILKVGVAPIDDAKNLLRDYGVAVRGCLDLRYLASAKGEVASGGLAGLAKNILGIQLNKDWKIRCSNWEAEKLSQEQCEYAALDALAAYEIFFKLAVPSGWFKSIEDTGSLLKTQHLCQQYLDVKYKTRKSAATDKSSKNVTLDSGKELKKFKPSSRSLCTRSRPLYDNCYLQAPDGELLCTCDNSKVKWYVSNKLGDIVSEDPLTVKLRFEPAGRAVGEVGDYYTQVKDNCCVVCGCTESYLRKNIIPHEYRKYFPAVMKDHTSHDVLLLCWSCHQLSNWHDMALRRKLAEKCQAPMGTKENVKRHNIPRLKEVRSAAFALLKNASRIPQSRKDELKNVILDYFKDQGQSKLELTSEMLEEASVIETCVLNQEYKSHGEKVVDFYKNSGIGGLVQLERMWREHFLDSMKPRFLPPLWSVTHNHHRLAQRAEQNRVLQEELNVAGLGHIAIKVANREE